MRAPAAAKELPDDYVLACGARGVLAVRREHARAFEAAGLGADGEWPLAPSRLAGRSPLRELELGRERLLVRRYRHGGLLRWLTGARFADPSRPFREIALAHALRQAGFRTPEICAARARRAAGLGHRLELVTRRVPEAVDLARWLASPESRADPATRARVFRAAGRLVRALHEQRFVHADLTPANLLLEPASLGDAVPRLWVIDLDGARRTEGPLDRETCRANLRRLLRHVERLEREGALALSRSDRSRFARAYEPDRARRHEDARAIGRVRSRWAPLHALGWLAERAAGGRREERRTSAQGSSAR